MDSNSNLILTCGNCGTKNRVPEKKTDGVAKCGKCRSILPEPGEGAAVEESLRLRCGKCYTKNRVPRGKLGKAPKCGKCGELLSVKDILTGQPVLVSDTNFDESVLQSPLPVLMYSWAPWCSGCKTTTPIIHDFAFDAKGKVRVGKLNVDTNPLLSSRFNIMSVPFLHIFDGGQMKDSLPGGMPKHQLMMKMAPYL
ncbi:MAG: thiol reductase thioredoxin [Desulfobacteraceae bacterium]|nr:thiol reductase thioredoxin [Desulfobacteraceae bacterium]